MPDTFETQDTSASGKYFNVVDNKTTLLTVSSQSVADGATGTFQYASSANEYYQSEVNSYIAANLEHDAVLAVSPTTPTRPRASPTTQRR